MTMTSSQMRELGDLAYAMADHLMSSEERHEKLLAGPGRTHFDAHLLGVCSSWNQIGNEAHAFADTIDEYATG